MDVPDFEIDQRDFGFIIKPTGSTPRVILTVQHNGLAAQVFDGLFTERDEKGLADMRTLALSTEIFHRTWPSTLVLYNQFPRKILDTNRNPKETRLSPRGGVLGTAYKDARMASYFESYHGALRHMTKGGQGEEKFLILDIHGFTRQPPYAPQQGFDVVMGTKNKRSIKREMVDQRLATILRDVGLCIFCPEESTALPGKTDYYEGGYLIGEHSKNPNVDAAIQIEIAPWLRESHEEISEIGTQKRASFVSAMVQFIGEFYA